MLGKQLFIRKCSTSNLGLILMIGLLIEIVISRNIYSESVVQINNIDDLQKIGNDLSYPLDGEYELTQDIDASDTINWNNGQGFAPIGSETNHFTGKFDGKGYKIRYLYINRPSQNNVGLFSYLGSQGQILNLELESAYVIGGYGVGIMAGYNYYGSIKQCNSKGSVIGESNIGGIVGNNFSGVLEQSYSISSILGWDTIGGVIGNNKGTVKQSYSVCNVYGVNNVGGLVGINSSNGSILQCYSNGKIYGTASYVGSLVGYNSGSITQSYSIGNVTGLSDYVGGLLGYNYYGSVDQCYSVGNVVGMGNNVGGLLGYNRSGTVSQCYWDIETSGQNSSSGGIGKTTYEMKQQETYVGWDFINVWDIENEKTYPWLRLLGNTQSQLSPVEKEIWNLQELRRVGNDWEYPWDAHYNLMVDIDASETVNWNEGKGFKPINVFTGIFNGNNHKILNLYVNYTSEKYIGLFGMNWGEVVNLRLENIHVSGGNNVSSTGALVAYNYYGKVLQSYSVGSVIGMDNVGGLVGKNFGGEIKQCYTTGNVSGQDYIGGLLGYNTSGSILQCYSMSNANGRYYIGGLLGYSSSGEIRQCYSKGKVIGIYSVEGLMGGDGTTVTECYWDTQTSGQSSSSGGIGKTTTEMKQQTTYIDWNFLSIWDIQNGLTYPWLRVLGPTQEFTSEEGIIEGEGTQEGTLEGEGEGEGIIEGIPEGEGTIIEGIIEGTNEGSEEGVVEGEGTIEGTTEGIIIEGVIDGTNEGSQEGIDEGEGTVEGFVEGGIIEGEGSSIQEGNSDEEGISVEEGEDTDKEKCGCLGKTKKEGIVWLEYLWDFVLIGILILVMSGMQKQNNN